MSAVYQVLHCDVTGAGHWRGRAESSAPPLNCLSQRAAYAPPQMARVLNGNQNGDVTKGWTRRV